MSFSSDVHRISKEMEVYAEDLAAAVFIELFSSVIRDTPVDEGRLRGEWQTTKNAPAAGQANRVQEGSHGAATSEVHATITDLGTYYLTNNMPYAERIEYGYSKVKAPEGMVRKNVLRLDSILRKRAK